MQLTTLFLKRTFEDFIVDYPVLFALLIVLGFVLIFMPFVPAINRAAKKQQELQNRQLQNNIRQVVGSDGETLTANNPILTNTTTINQQYYRYQSDRQPIIKRDAEQQKIVDEYFIIKNNITKNSALLAFGIILMLIGFIMFIVSVSKGVPKPGVLIFGLLFIIVGIILMGAYNKNVTYKPGKVMTDDEYEQLVKNKINSMGLRSRSLNMLGLDPEQVSEIEPIIITDKSVIKTSLKVYNPSTQLLHSSTQYVTFLYFTDEQLLIYKIQFDMCCNKQEEWTCEFFYKDICDVSSYLYNNIIEIGKDKLEHKSIKFTIISSNSEIGFELDSNNARFNSIQAMKQKIREKKAQ